MIKRLLLGATILLSIGTNAQDFEELMKIVASDRDTEDRLGWSVDIDENFAIVGAYADDFGATNPNMGSAYIYQKIGLEWIEVQKLSNSDQDDYDRFGWSVAIDGDYAIVGAYGEDHNADDGESLSKAGSAYIFEKNEDGVWEEVEKLVAADRAADDEFGWSVAIHGTTAVVGAHIDDKDEDGLGDFYHAGSAYVFDRGVDGSWTQSQKLVAPDRSTGTVYAPDHEDWNDRFGESVAIWNDYIVVAGYFAAKGYLFEKSGGDWEINSLLTYPGLFSFDRASAVSIEGTTVVMGAQTEDHDVLGDDYLMNAGAAAIFKRNVGGTWDFTQKLIASDRDAGDHFGISVSISGDFVVVGAHSDNHDEDGGAELENTGGVFVFELQGDGSYLQTIKLDASDRAEDDELGISVSISGNTIIAGAFQQSEIDGGGEYIEDAGAAYIYTNDPDDPGCVDVFVTQEVEICAGTSVEVGASTYETAGVYEDVLMSAAGCDSVVTTILEVTPAIINVQEVSICEGSFIVVGENVYTESGIYTDFLSNPAGCDSIVQTFLEVGDAINTVVDVDGFLLEAQETGVTYQWIDCETGADIIGETNPIFEPTVNGQYAVVLSNGTCSETSDCITISTIGISENEAILNLSVFPNPTNGNIVINGDNLTGSELTIYNSIGETIVQKTLLSTSAYLDLSNESHGMYVVRITNGNGTSVKRIMLQ